MRLYPLGALALAGFLVISAAGQSSYPTQGGTAGISGQGAGVSDTNPIVAGDIISVHVFDEPDLDALLIRVTDAGTVPLLLIGDVKIGGMTAGEAATTIANAYMQKHMLRNAHVQVVVATNASANATVFGYVNGQNNQITGTSVPLTAPRPLLAVLAMAGGMSDRASRTVTIQHRNPARPRETVFLPHDAQKQLDDDPMVDPGDIVVVPRAESVYVLGNVGRPSILVMNNPDGRLTLLQAMSEAGSPLPTAELRRIRLFRKQNGTYQPIEVNLGKILKGKIPDIPLLPEDAIWVPFSYGKNLLVNGPSITSAIAAAGASAAVYGTR